MKISINKILNEIRKNKIEIYYNTNGHDHLFNNISRLINSDGSGCEARARAT